MVNATTISASNLRFARERSSGLVCVFAGATSGIGAATLQSMALLVQESTFYVIGRSEFLFASQRAKLETLNRSIKIVFLEAEVSLISEIDIACRKIASAERKVDLLYMSPGLMPLTGAQYTIEGLETCFAISYYSRMRLTSNLLPLLHKSPHPRILSVLNGGQEKPLREDDIGLEHHWSAISVINHTTTMTSLAFSYLAENEKKIIFLHVAPGLVPTTIFSRLGESKSSSLAWGFILLFIRGFVAILTFALGTSVEDCGERQAFHLTSDEYGSGAWRVDEKSNIIVAKGVFDEYVERGWPEKVWEHTVRVFEKALSVGTEDVRI